MSETDTRTQLLDVAHSLVEQRGFNGFSFHDLSAAVGIRTPSVHYHFPSKADLGDALISRYLDRLIEALDNIDRRHASARKRLEAFIQVYRVTQQRHALCLCGSLASDVGAIPEPLEAPVRRYMERSESWLRATIAAGRDAGEFTAGLDPARLATLFLASLQGALVVAHAQSEKAARGTMQRVRTALLDTLSAEPGSTRPN